MRRFDTELFLVFTEVQQEVLYGEDMVGRKESTWIGFGSFSCTSEDVPVLGFIGDASGRATFRVSYMQQHLTLRLSLLLSNSE